MPTHKYDAEYYRYCHHHRHSYTSGLFILLAGIFLLLNSFGVVPWQIWDFIWPFWPVALILLGLRIIFGRIPGAEIMMFLITLSALCVVIAYGLVHVNSPLVAHMPHQLVDFVKSFTIN